VWDKAVAYGRQAGTKAIARSALREVVACVEQALDALTHLPESRATQEQAIDLRLDLWPALWVLGDIRQMLDHLRQAATLAVAATLGDFALQVMAHNYLGVAYQILGDQRRALGLLRSNVESLAGDLLRERFGMATRPAVRSRAHLAQCLAELGAFPEGIAHAEEALRIAEALDHPHSLINAYSNLGFLFLRKGDLSRAIPALERCLDLCRVYNMLLWSLAPAAALGCAYALSGRVAEALPLLEQAEQRRAALGTMGARSLRVGYLSEAYLLAGRTQEAVHLAGHALGLARTHKERGHEAWALRLLGKIAAHQAPPEIEPATNHYRQALALADELGMRPLMAHCHLGLGRLYAKTGQQEEGRAELSTAVEMYRAMAMTFWLPAAERALTEVERR
jgi:tetratricopeptide (TPR) repeat protein